MSEVSLDKSAGAGAPRAGRARPARAPRPDVPKVPTVRTVDLACMALAATVFALWVSVLGTLGSDDKMMAWAIDLNQKADKPDKNFDAMQYVHQTRIGGAIQAAVVTVVFALLITAFRRTRSASSSRWVLVIIMVFLSLPAYLIPTSGFPIIAQVGRILTGLASLAAIVLIFVPQSRQYFKDCRAAALPPHLQGQERPTLGSLFKARGAGRNAARGPGATRPTTRPAASSASSAKAKAKVRSDADAVAKGAELARARAKSSKTRRSE